MAMERYSAIETTIFRLIRLAIPMLSVEQIDVPSECESSPRHKKCHSKAHVECTRALQCVLMVFFGIFCAGTKEKMMRARARTKRYFIRCKSFSDGNETIYEHNSMRMNAGFCVNIKSFFAFLLAAK